MTDSNALDQITALIDQQWQETPDADIWCEVPIALWKEGLAEMQISATEYRTRVRTDWDTTNLRKRDNYLVRDCPVMVGQVAKTGFWARK